MADERDHYKLQAAVEISIPHGRPWLLTNEQFHMLDTGDPGDVKPWMFLCLGLFLAEIEAILSTLQNADWSVALAQHMIGPFVHLLIEIFVAAFSFAGFWICVVLLRRKTTFCSDMKVRMRQHFANLPNTEAAAPEQIPNANVVPEADVAPKV
jgi:hypothetical protein